MFHTLVVFTAVARIAYKVASYPEFTKRQREDNDDSVSGTEHPSESDATKCQAYKIQLMRDRYRLLVDAPCNAPTTDEIYVSDCDIAGRVLGGVEVSGPPPPPPPRLLLCVEPIDFYTKFV